MQNIHEGKRYKCDLCNFEFKGLSGLHYHKQANHTEIPNMYKCNVCDLTFKMEPNLKKHIKSVHLKTLRYNC